MPGIRYVIDAGFAASAATVRAARSSACRSSASRRPAPARRRCAASPRDSYGLYDEDDFNARPVFTEPEIQRTNLAAVILQMATLGFGNRRVVPFVDPPDLAPSDPAICGYTPLGGAGAAVDAGLPRDIARQDVGAACRSTRVGRGGGR